MEQTTKNIKLINRDMIKYLAIIPMVIGHFCGYLWGDLSYEEQPLVIFVLQNMALFAPPIFFFFIAQGFQHTHSRRKYALRLLIFALLNQIPFCLMNYGTLLTIDFFLNWNIIFTLFLGLLALIVWDSKLKLAVRIIVIVLIDTLTVAVTSEWMIFGIPIILGFYIFREKPRQRLIWFFAMSLGMEMLQFILMGTNIFNLFSSRLGIFMLAATLIQLAFMALAYFVVTKCYNGEKGKHPVFAKWFFYILYPLHLWAIYVVQLLSAKQ